MKSLKIWLVQAGFLLFVVTIQIAHSSSFQPRRIKFAGCYDDGEVAKPKAVFLTCANKRGVCEVRRGLAHNIRFFFTPEMNSTQVESAASWNSWFQVPLPNQDNDGCKYLFKNCPLRADKLTAFTYKLNIDSYWPPKTYPVIWTLADKETEEEILCFRFKINIV